MRTEISQLYTALFGRAPDADGMGFWVGLRNDGQSLTQIANTMYDTAPARAYYPLFLTNQEIIGSFYSNVLGRTADAEGLAFWTAKLNAPGATPGSVITEMIDVVAHYGGSDPAGLLSQSLFNNKAEVAQYYAEHGGDIANATLVLAGVSADDSTVAAAMAAIDSGTIGGADDAGQVFNLHPEAAAGADVMRLTGDQDVRIDFTNPANQVKGLDLNGDGIIANDGVENNISGVASGYEIVDAYARNPLNEGDRTHNFLGDIKFDGTAFGGDGVSTDGNIFLGGLGADTAFGGVGNDFLAGGGVAANHAGADTLSGGRNADFFYVELSPLDNADGNDVAIDGGNTADDTAAGTSASSQDADWLLLEASDDDEPVTVRLESSLADENGDGNFNNDGYVQSRSGQTVGTLKDVENLDASGNLYGFLDNMDIEIGGRRLDDRDGQGSANYGLGSSAQLNVIGSIERNIIVGGYDNDHIDGGDGNDVLLGGNLQFLMETVLGGVTNPNMAGIAYDGVDQLIGGAGDDTFLLELDSGSADGGDGNDTVFLTNYSIGRPEATEAASLEATLAADQKIRIDLGYEDYRGYRGDTLGEFTDHSDEANSTSTSDWVAGTADQTNYAPGKAATMVTGMENVIATGLGQIDYLAAGTNDPELNFANQQNFHAIHADLELRGTDNVSYSFSMQGLEGLTSMYQTYVLTTTLLGQVPLSFDAFSAQTIAAFNSMPGNEQTLIMTIEGGNILYASTGDDIIEGRMGDDKLSGGVGNDDFVFQLSNDSVGFSERFVETGNYNDSYFEGDYGIWVDEASSFDTGDGVDVIHRQTDANHDNIWDGTFERDFGLDETSTVGASVLRIDIAKVGGNAPSDELSDVVNFVSEIATGVEVGGTFQAITLNTAAIKAATTYEGLTAAINAALDATPFGADLEAALQADGHTIYITDALGRTLADSISEVPGAGVTVQQKANTQTANVFEFGEPEVSISQDRLIYKAYEDRGRNEGVDDDAVLGSTISLGHDAYAQDLVINFAADGTRIAEDQHYTIAFADLTTEDVVTITVNGVVYHLEVGLDLDGGVIDAEDTLHNSQADVQASFLGRLTDFINSFMDDDTAAGQVGASLDGSVLSLYQRTYAGEETVFMTTPEVSLTNRSGGIMPVAVVDNKSSHEVHLLDFDGRDGALNRDNVLFVGEEFINRSVLQTADNAGGAMNGSEALLVDAGADTLAGIAQNLAVNDYHIDGNDFSVHGDDFLLGGNGNDIIKGLTGDDRVVGSLGMDDLDGGKDYYAVQFLGEAEARVFQLNDWEAANPTQVAAIQAVITSGKIFSSLELIDQSETGHSLVSGKFSDTLIYQQADFTPGVSRFTITLDDFTVVGGVVQLKNGGAGHVGVDANGDGTIEAGNVSKFTNFENIRTVSGTGAATAGHGQGNDTLNVSALSTATGGISYNLTNNSGPGQPGAVKYSATGNPFIVNAVPANANTAAGDFPIGTDYETIVMHVDGVENVIAGTGNDALFLDETEAAKNNRFEAGLGTDRVAYLNNFSGSIVAEPTVTIKVGALGSDTDTVSMTGGRVGATGASDTPTDTLVSVEYIDLQQNTARGDEENDVLDVTALSAGAVVDYTNGEVRTGVAAGSGVQVVIQNIVQMENVWADGNDLVIVADSDVMNNNSRSDENDGTPAENLEFMSYLDFDQLNASATTRKSFAAQVAAGEVAQVINQGEFTFSLSKVGTDADTDRVDYSHEDGRISVAVGQGTATLPQFVMVDGDMDGDYSDAQSRVDRLESVEEIVAAQGESIMDFTTVGAARQITFQYVAPSAAPANGQVVEQTVRIADGSGNTIDGLTGFIEKYVYNTATNTGDDATWSRVEGSDAAEIVIYDGSEDLVAEAGLDHRYSDDVLTLRGGANEVRYSPLETSITATITVTEENLATTGVSEGLITAVIDFQDGVTQGSILDDSGQHTITSYTSDNTTAAGSLKIEGSQDAEDTLAFTGLSEKVYILGTSPGVINVDIGSLNTMVLTGFEYLQDSLSNDVYDMQTLASVVGNLTLVDDGFSPGPGGDHDTIKVYNDAIGFGAAPGNTIDLKEFNSAFVFDFDALDVTGVSSALLTTLIGDTTFPGAPGEEVVLGAINNITTLTDFEGVVFTQATLAQTGTTFVYDTTANTITGGLKVLTATTAAPQGVNTVSFRGLVLEAGTIDGGQVANVTSAINFTVTGGDAVAVFGGDGADTITGGGGDDFIVGGKGADVLDGGIAQEVRSIDMTGMLAADGNLATLDWLGQGNLVVSEVLAAPNGVNEVIDGAGTSVVGQLMADYLNANLVQANADWQTVYGNPAEVITGVTWNGGAAGGTFTFTFAEGVDVNNADGVFAIGGGGDTGTIAFSAETVVTEGGDGGADTFAYVAASESTTAAMDSIIGFSFDADLVVNATDGDVIDLSAIDADTATAGDQAFANSSIVNSAAASFAALQTAANAFLGGANDVYVGRTATDAYVFVDTNNDGSVTAADLVVKLTGVTDLTDRKSVV